MYGLMYDQLYTYTVYNYIYIFCLVIIACFPITMCNCKYSIFVEKWHLTYAGSGPAADCQLHPEHPNRGPTDSDGGWSHAQSDHWSRGHYHRTVRTGPYLSYTLSLSDSHF